MTWEFILIVRVSEVKQTAKVVVVVQQQRENSDDD